MPVRYKLETKGFSEYLERLVQAGQDIDRIADQALEVGGDIIAPGYGSKSSARHWKSGSSPRAIGAGA